METSLIVRTHQDAGLWIGRRRSDRGPARAGAPAPRSPRPAPASRRSPASRRTGCGAARPASAAIADIACYFAVRDPGDAARPRRPPARGRRGRVRLRQAAGRAPGPRARPTPSAPRPPGPAPATRATSTDPPHGIGAEAAWKRDRRPGEGVRIIDVEADWRFTHEDLQPPRAALTAAARPATSSAATTAPTCSGCSRPIHNGRGIQRHLPRRRDPRPLLPAGGLAGAARARSRPPPTRSGPATSSCSRCMRPGPQHAGTDADDALGYLAVEYWPDDLTAIQYATSHRRDRRRGRGRQRRPGPRRRRLRRPRPRLPRRTAPTRSRATGLDSGAVVVGAGAPPPGGDRRARPLAAGVLQLGQRARRAGLGRATSPPPAASARAPTRAARRGRGPLVHRPLQRHVERRADGGRRARLRAGRPARRRAPPADPRAGARARCARPARRSSRPPTARSSGSATAPTSAELIEWAMERAPRADRHPRHRRRAA